MINIDAHIKNADWPKRTPDKMSDLVQKFDPSQPRDEKGRWVTLYHGTRAAFVQSIKETGLIPGNKEKLVWATESREFAEEFAKNLNYPDPTPDATVVEIRAPKSAFFFEKPLTPGKKNLPGTRIARFVGGVPAKYIVKWDESQHPRDDDGKFAESVTVNVVDAPHELQTRYSGDTSIVAVEFWREKEFVGYIELIAPDASKGQESDYAVVADVVLGHEYRGKKLGSALYTRAVKEAQKRGWAGIQPGIMNSTSEAIWHHWLETGTAKWFRGMVREKWDESQHPRDAQGQFTVYHGSNVVGITEFAPKYSAVTAWFSEHQSLAQDYATAKTRFLGGTPTVYSATLSLKKPLVIQGDMNAKTTYREERERTGLTFTVGKYGDEVVDGVEQKYTRHQIISSPEFVAAAKAKGYDGLRVMEGGHPTWGVFNSAQVRPVARKWDESKHPRGKGGRFTQVASVTVDGREIAVVKPRRAERETLVMIDVAKFEASFSQQVGFYVGPGGTGGAIGNRYANFGEFIAAHDAIEAPEAYVHPNGRVDFTNGRHRYAWLRDHGVTAIPMALDAEGLRNAKKHGYISDTPPIKKKRFTDPEPKAIRDWVVAQYDRQTKKYDPTQPRDEEGQWTAGPGEVGEIKIHDKGFVKLPGQYDRTEVLEGRLAIVSKDGYLFLGEGKIPGTKWVAHVRVSDKAQGKGVATALYAAAVEEIQKRGGIGIMKGGTKSTAGGPDRVPYQVSDQAQALWDRFKAEGYTTPFTDEDGYVHDVLTKPPVFRKQGYKGYPTLKQEHKFGSTQIQIAPHSSAALSLNMARDAILDADTMADGKDVDPNHLTVRYGLLNSDVEALRVFIARQSPFTANVRGVTLFPASEHSDGAVPVVANIESPELRAIEKEIGTYADFKEKNFPEYRPHCTLAYCKPEMAGLYADLHVDGTFVVQEITISHASGVKETIPFSGAYKWDESKHKRQPSGTSRGGEFTAYHGVGDAVDSALAGETVNIDRGNVRKFLERIAEQEEDLNLTHVQVEGLKIFGGNGLGIKRENMPQIPKEHRANFLKEMAALGVKITEEMVDPLTLKPTQKEISAQSVIEKLEKYEKGGKVFPPVLISLENRILDGHHHWGVMAAFATEAPTAQIPVYRLHITVKDALARMHVYDKKYGLLRKAIFEKKKKTTKKEAVKDRYVTPFVSFDPAGNKQLQLIASLNSSRLATWGFTAEAEARGMARYRITAVLDGRTSDFCRMISGKIFEVPDARRKVIEVLNVQNPEDLKTVQPWPKQTKAAIAEFAEMSPAELTELGFHIPPYHPYCRTICRPVEASLGEEMETVPTIPVEAEAFQPVTAADLKELGIDATPEDVAAWNEHVGMSPVELLSKFSGLPPQEVMTKPLGVGANPIRFEAGNIGFHVRGENTGGVEFALGAILDPFTGIYYLSQAQLTAGTPVAEMRFLKNMFNALIDMGEKSSATSIAVGVAGNASYYAKLGFLPDELEWDDLRTFATSEIETGKLTEVIASLSPIDQVLVKQLLQDKSVGAMSALVELPFTYQGKTIGEWLFGDAAGTWALDLTDDLLVAQARAYLS